MKVYVIFYTGNSLSLIEAVCTTREKAKVKLKKLMKEHGEDTAEDYTISEHEVEE